MRAYLFLYPLYMMFYQRRRDFRLLSTQYRFIALRPLLSAAELQGRYRSICATSWGGHQ